MSRRRLHIESLEARLVLSLSLALGPDVDAGPVEVANLDSADNYNHSPARGGNPGPPDGGGGGGGGKPSGPVIDLPTVALHEFGHSLGLGHSSHSNCGKKDLVQPVMCPFYLGENLVLHDEDITGIQTLYPESGANVAGSWDSPSITYSFTPDGARMDQGGRNKLFETMDDAFASTAQWQQIFKDALGKWAAASEADGTTVKLVFTEETVDDGSAFNTSGASQGDSRFGDIRIAAHNFDGTSGTIAHAYFPPPNGSTAAGDAHFDKAENWQVLPSSLSTASFTIGSGGNVGAGDMTLLVADSSVAAELTVTGFWTSSPSDEPAADIAESVFADLDTDDSADLIAPPSQEIYLERAMTAIGRRMSARATDDAFDRMSRGEADHVLEELSEDLSVPLSF